MCSVSLSVHPIITLALYPQSLQSYLPAVTSASSAVSGFAAVPDPDPAMFAFLIPGCETPGLVLEQHIPLGQAQPAQESPAHPVPALPLVFMAWLI